MGNIQNRKREYESGLNSLNVNTLIKKGRVSKKQPNEPLAKFVERAAKAAQHFQELEESRKDPKLAGVRKYIEEKGW